MIVVVEQLSQHNFIIVNPHMVVEIYSNVHVVDGGVSQFQRFKLRE